MIAVGLVIIIGLLLVTVPVMAALGLSAFALADLFSNFPLARASGQIAWRTSTNFLLVAIPLFVLLGELLLRSGMADRMYRALALWLPWLPGGLMHTNIASCALFAATSGSSVATAATVGTVAIQEIDRGKYSPRLFLGSIAAGGTLGILIPPSINLIVYGVLTDTSIPKLYLGGVVPGILAALIFMVIIAAACLLWPALDGNKVSSTWQERWRSLPDLLPPIIIFVIVVGSIYMGLATATEAAGLGVIGALGVIMASGRLRWSVLKAAFEGTVRTNAMIMAIIVAAYILNFTLATLGVSRAIEQIFARLDLGPLGVIGLCIVLYVILGMFLETLSMMVLTVPIIGPILVGSGVDPIWSGIFVVIMMEIGLITPPVGLNLFVVQGLRKEGGIKDIIIGVAPFFFGLLALVGILVIFPECVTWLAYKI